MSDERERIDELREEVDSELQVDEQAMAAIRPTTGADSTGQITVHLDTEGRVSSVLSAGSWRQHLEPAALPGAVLQAHTAAVEARQQQWLEAYGEAEPGQARPVSAPPMQELDQLTVELRDSGGDLPQSALRGMMDMLDELERGFDSAFEKVEESLGAQLEGRSSSGHARARVAGSGELISVSYDERWLTGAHAFNVGRETTEAIHAALQQCAVHSVAAITESSGLAALQEVTRDPAAMLRRLGL